MADAKEEIRPSACPLDCPDGCSLAVTVRDGMVVAIDGDGRHPLTGGVICAKVRRFDRHVNAAERLRRPLIRRPGGPKGTAEGFRPASWDEALDLVVARMREVAARTGGEGILPVSYGGSNGRLTEGSVDRRLFRRLRASRLRRSLCAGPTGEAHAAMYGPMPGLAIQDYEHAALVVLWGMNPSASGIHLVPPVQRAQERGARLVVIDPRRTPLARRADLHLALRPGTDLPLALGVIRRLFAEGGADLGFLAAHTRGADELRARAEPWTIARTAEACGLAAADVAHFATLYATSSPAALRCGWGLERNRNGGAAVAAVLALPAVGGKFGVRGGGYSMSSSRAWELADATNEPPADRRTIDINRLGRALLGDPSPPVELLFVYDCNPLATLPDQNRVRRGLQRADLFTVVFEQVMTDTARYADVVLPATTFLEHHELRNAYGAYALQLSRPVVPPVGEARPNYEVFAALLRRLGLHRPGDPETPEELVRTMLAGHPATLAALERDGIAFPAIGDRPVQFADVFPRTSDGRVHLFPARLDHAVPHGLYVYRPEMPDSRHPLALFSPATRQRISSTFGELHRGIVPVELHPADAAARGIGEGDVVRIWNDLGEVRTTATLTPDVRPGVAVLPKGLWSHNTLGGGTANALAPDTLADLAHGACFNDARVEVERWGPPPAGAGGDGGSGR
ncbi:MAG: molybdopterin-dependent oxidoreductase [Planctomycetota bacterium]